MRNEDYVNIEERKQYNLKMPILKSSEKHLCGCLFYTVTVLWKKDLGTFSFYLELGENKWDSALWGRRFASKNSESLNRCN